MATILLNQTNRLRVSGKELEIIKQLCHLSKNLFNVGLYNVRQYFFTEGKFLRYELQSLCTRSGINYIEQEESYTSKSSFLDRDILPDYNADNPQKYSFKGKRIKRGLYKTAKGLLVNADVNGAHYPQDS